jgi:hypothetical protein
MKRAYANPPAENDDFLQAILMSRCEKAMNSIAHHQYIGYSRVMLVPHLGHCMS